MTQHTSSRRGRPRSATTDARILATARALIETDGVPALTVEGVAARCGVAKTTIYRRFRSAYDLGLAVLVGLVQEIPSVADVGDVRAELLAFVEGEVDLVGRGLLGRVLQGLVSEVAADRQLASDLRERVLALRVEQVSAILARAAERAEVSDGLDVELVHELLVGPVFFRRLLSGSSVDDRLAHRVVEAVLPSLRP